MYFIDYFMLLIDGILFLNNSNIKPMKSVKHFKLKTKYKNILTGLFNQLHLIIITIVLILYSVETASAQCLP